MIVTLHPNRINPNRLFLQVLEERDAQMRAAQGKRLNVIVPACKDMCPELERYSREASNDLHRLELKQAVYAATGRKGMPDVPTKMMGFASPRM
jgi:hypothetical protein